jgi:hypothetical protein
MSHGALHNEASRRDPFLRGYAMRCACDYLPAWDAAAAEAKGPVINISPGMQTSIHLSNLLSIRGADPRGQLVSLLLFILYSTVYCARGESALCLRFVAASERANMGF